MRIAFRLLTVALMALATTITLAAQNPPPQVYTPGDGITLPVPVMQVRPEYTQEAKDAGIQGTVMLDCVVLSDGTMGDVTVSRSLDSKLGLDQEAIKAAKQWTFKPGTKDGMPVAVRVAMEMMFTLK
jgi:protein TonB